MLGNFKIYRAEWLAYCLNLEKCYYMFLVNMEGISDGWILVELYGRRLNCKLAYEFNSLAREAGEVEYNRNCLYIIK